MREADWGSEPVQAVIDLVNAVSSHRDRERLFRAVGEALRPLVRFDCLAVNLDGPGRDEMTPYFIQPRTSVPVLKRSRSALDQVFATGKPLYVRSRADVADYPGSARILEQLGMHSYLALPLLVQGGVIGVIVMHRDVPGGYDDVDLEVLGDLAAVIAVALDHCLVYETIERSRARLVNENKVLRAALHDAHGHGAVVATSPAMREVVRLIDLVAPTDATVLLLGETGAGKERLARLVHERSARADRPMVTINCAAIPTGLIESELFGHEVGAFTGATRRRRGRFELAHRGTLFLDEIGELPAEAQAKLLRVLQHQELERVGGSETIQVDVRVIAATNRDLKELIGAGRFRDDLYYRLAVFPIEVPPLWARRDDIPALARDFVEQSARRLGRQPSHLDADTIRALQAYSWPGNVRELQNVIERAVILSGGGILHVEPLLEHAEPATAPAPGDETRALREVLEATAWVIEGADGAAARLGLHPSTLRSRMRKLGVERPR